MFLATVHGGHLPLIFLPWAAAFPREVAREPFGKVQLLKHFRGPQALRLIWAKQQLRSMTMNAALDTRSGELDKWLTSRE
jgi:hypothetical protein